MTKVPYNQDAEEYILGTILYNYSKVKAYVDKAEPKLFYIKQNKYISRAVKELHTDGKKIDIVTIQEKLEEKSKLEDAGGYEKLADLKNESFAVDNFEGHLAILVDNYERRQLLITMKQVEDGLVNKKDLSGLKSQLSKNLHTSGKSSNSVIKGEFTEFQKKTIKEKLTRTTIGTGYTSLDETLTKGFAPADLSLITARPSMGKSAFKENVILNQIMRGAKVLNINLEHTAEDELDRLVAMESGIPLYDIINIKDWVSLEDGKFKTEMPRKLSLIKKTTQKMDTFGLYIEDGMLSLPEIRSLIVNYREVYDVDIVFIDLLDRVEEVWMSTRNKPAKITQVVGSLASLASDYNIHICGLVQQKRRKKKKEKPSISQLKGSGSFEEYADLIFGIYREFVDDEEMLEDNSIDIYIKKQRQGSLGKFELNWDSETLRITEGEGIYE